MFNDVSVSSAYSFASKKLRVIYVIIDVYRVTVGVVKVAIAICVFINRHTTDPALTNDIPILMDFTLTNNIFKFYNHHY